MRLARRADNSAFLIVQNVKVMMESQQSKSLWVSNYWKALRLFLYRVLLTAGIWYRSSKSVEHNMIKETIAKSESSGVSSVWAVWASHTTNTNKWANSEWVGSFYIPGSEISLLGA
jgi:hypothetical protein